MRSACAMAVRAVDALQGLTSAAMARMSGRKRGGGSPAQSPGTVGPDASGGWAGRGRSAASPGHAGEAVGAVGQAEPVRHVGGSAGTGFVPRDHRELVGQRFQLGCPGTAALGATVDEEHRSPVTAAALGETEPVHVDGLREPTVVPQPVARPHAVGREPACRRPSSPTPTTTAVVRSPVVPDLRWPRSAPTAWVAARR